MTGIGTHLPFAKSGVTVGLEGEAEIVGTHLAAMPPAAVSRVWLGLGPPLDTYVACWTTQKYLPAAIRLVEAWGLRHVLTMVWHKRGGFQPIDLPQYNCEFIVYARKGAPVVVDTTE